MDAQQIAAVGRFNRLVAQRAGALEGHFLGRGRPLGQSRVLWEIGLDGADLRDVRTRLGLDSGYLSRLVQALEAEGLVEVEPARDDERVRRARPTAAGLDEIGEMDRQCDAGAERVLDPLSATQRTRLVDAMDEVRRLLLASAVRIDGADPGDRDVRWCLEQYYAELERRFPDGFDPSSSLHASPEDFSPPRGSFLVATVDGQPVACGGLTVVEPGIVLIKRMWASPDLRGIGLGKRMLRTLEEEAGRLGGQVLRLETNRSLSEAIGLYRAAGFREIAPFNDDPYADHWFEKALEKTKMDRAARHGSAGRDRPVRHGRAARAITPGSRPESP